MSEKKNKQKKVSDLLKYDSLVEDPQDIIASDKDVKRKEAFNEAYKRIAQIPVYFNFTKKKPNSGTTGGTAFSQNIVVTPDKVAVETKEIVEEVKEDKQEEKERE